jgi:hypothetical protein
MGAELGRMACNSTEAVLRGLLQHRVRDFFTSSSLKSFGLKMTHTGKRTITVSREYEHAATASFEAAFIRAVECSACFGTVGRDVIAGLLDEESKLPKRIMFEIGSDQDRAQWKSFLVYLQHLSVAPWPEGSTDCWLRQRRAAPLRPL